MDRYVGRQIPLAAMQKVLGACTHYSVLHMQADSHPAHAIYDLDNTILHQLCWNDWNTGSFMRETEQSSAWLALFVWSAWCRSISLSFHVSVLETDPIINGQPLEVL